jgi:hypothetical protein
MMTGPENGWAYSKVELEAIFALEISFDELANSHRIRMFEFHAAACRLPNNPERERDNWACQLIGRAVASDIVNDQPRDPDATPTGDA